jgi:phosphoglycerol transferase MdoB-like AlkP superfamily enzyme
MKRLTLALAKRLLFWMLYFAFLRLVFLAWYQVQLFEAGVPFSQVILSFWHALPLDLSTASYILSLSFILLLVFMATGLSLFRMLEKYLNVVLIYIFSLIHAAELGLFGEWNTKLSYKALGYLANPGEVFNSFSTTSFMILVVVWFFQAWLAIMYMRKSVLPLDPPDRRGYAAGYTLIFVPLLIFLGIRGGIREIPISISASYYSQHQMLNLAATNSGYNLMVSVLDSSRIGRINPFTYMSREEARDMARNLHQTDCDSTIRIIDAPKPNVVILLLESWSADLIESLGGQAGITPNFKKLEQDGLLFTEFYASGNRTQQAMGSLFAGLPALPLITITSYPEKYQALPSLVRDMSKAGYHSSFWFGGQLIYGNILSFLVHNGFDDIREGKHLPSNLKRGKLGVHDMEFLTHAATALNDYPQPFFSTLFTLSSHSPYDFPMEHVIQWPEMEKEFVNSAHYTDKALGAFFEIARKQEWYKNTLFIIMADHSHKSYRNHPLESFEYHKVPLLFYGPVLKNEFKGQHIEQICGNTDIPASLLAQLGMDASAYRWSKNFMNTCYRPFAFFELNDGFGFKRQEGYLIWNHYAGSPWQLQAADSLQGELTIQGKAYMQALMDEFMAF